MNISQDTFNKIISILLFSYFLVMYTLSYITGKPLSIESALTLAVPTINHIVHQITQAQVVTKNIESATTTQVATIQSSNGGAHSEQKQ